MEVILATQRRPQLETGHVDHEFVRHSRVKLEDREHVCHIDEGRRGWGGNFWNAVTASGIDLGSTRSSFGPTSTVLTPAVPAAEVRMLVAAISACSKPGRL
jgi:hypothetical protein